MADEHLMVRICDGKHQLIDVSASLPLRARPLLPWLAWQPQAGNRPCMDMPAGLVTVLH